MFRCLIVSGGKEKGILKGMPPRLMSYDLWDFAVALEVLEPLLLALAVPVPLA